MLISAAEMLPTTDSACSSPSACGRARSGIRDADRLATRVRRERGAEEHEQEQEAEQDQADARAERARQRQPSPLPEGRDGLAGDDHAVLSFGTSRTTRRSATMFSPM